MHERLLALVRILSSMRPEGTSLEQEIEGVLTVSTESLNVLLGSSEEDRRFESKETTSKFIYQNKNTMLTVSTDDTLPLGTIRVTIAGESVEAKWN